MEEIFGGEWALLMAWLWWGRAEGLGEDSQTSVPGQLPDDEIQK